MRRFYCLFFLVICSLYAIAQTQSSLIIDAPENELFTILVNGYQQNYTPGARVEINGLKQSTYKVQVIFQDSSIDYTEMDILIPEHTEVVYSLEYYLTKAETQIKNYKLQFVSSKNLLQGTIYDSVLSETSYEKSMVYIYGPNSPEPNTRNIILSRGSEEIVIKDEATEYPVELPTQIVVYQKTQIGSKCPLTVSDDMCKDVIIVLENQSNEKDKLDVTKKMISNFQSNNNCFKAAQLKDILKTFNNDTSRVIVTNVVKDLISDPINYALLKEAFDDVTMFNP